MRWNELLPSAQTQHHRDKNHHHRGVVEESTDGDGQQSQHQHRAPSATACDALEPMAKGFSEACALHRSTDDEHKGDGEDGIVAKDIAEDRCLSRLVRGAEDRVSVEGNDQQQEECNHRHDVGSNLLPDEHGHGEQHENTNKDLIGRHVARSGRI